MPDIMGIAAPAIAAPTGPSTARWRSKQDYGTPPELLAAVEARFGRIAIDLAAHQDNHVVPAWYGPGSAIATDSLACDWTSIEGVAWCNPEYSMIQPWAAKAASARWRPGWTLMLVPASVGSRWYADHVHGQCLELFLFPRLTFNGCAMPYPRDVALFAYGFGVSGCQVWNWKGER